MDSFCEPQQNLIYCRDEKLYLCIFTGNPICVDVSTCLTHPRTFRSNGQELRKVCLFVSGPMQVPNLKRRPRFVTNPSSLFFCVRIGVNAAFKRCWGIEIKTGPQYSAMRNECILFKQTSLNLHHFSVTLLLSSASAAAWWSSIGTSGIVATWLSNVYQKTCSMLVLLDTWPGGDEGIRYGTYIFLHRIVNYISRYL